MKVTEFIKTASNEDIIKAFNYKNVEAQVALATALDFDLDEYNKKNLL